MKKVAWRHYLPKLEHLIDETSCQLLDNAMVMTLAENKTIFQAGDSCQNYLILLEGSVKVFTRAENGREILLYRLNQGDSCVLTTSCLFGHKNYPAEGKTETAVIALAISATKFNQVLQQSAHFRKLVFSAFSNHLSDLITLIEEVAFGKLDHRLIKYLLQHGDENLIVNNTHQNIAIELGSAREVISRQLKELELKSFIKISRGKIQLKQIEALKKLLKATQ